MQFGSCSFLHDPNATHRRTDFELAKTYLVVLLINPEISVLRPQEVKCLLQRFFGMNCSRENRQTATKKKRKPCLNHLWI